MQVYKMDLGGLFVKMCCLTPCTLFDKVWSMEKKCMEKKCRLCMWCIYACCSHIQQKKIILKVKSISSYGSLFPPQSKKIKINCQIKFNSSTRNKAPWDIKSHCEIYNVAITRYKATTVRLKVKLHHIKSYCESQMWYLKGQFILKLKFGHCLLLLISCPYHESH